jgi:hypothetical protein
MAAEGGGAKALTQREQDIQMMLAADVHLGTKNCDFQMERYVYKRRTDGTPSCQPASHFIRLGYLVLTDLRTVAALLWLTSIFFGSCYLFILLLFFDINC